MTGESQPPRGRPPRILVIKHGALGDFIQALGPMRAIRMHHEEAGIILLTAPALAGFARASGLADAVWCDSRPGPCAPRALGRIIARLRRRPFDRVYDLQTSTRTNWYFRMMPRPKPEWSGIARGASHRHRGPERRRMHTLDRQRDQLAHAGILAVPPPDLGWVEGDAAAFGLGGAAGGYALLVPGAGPRRPGKRWPADRFGALARSLHGRGLLPVIAGTDREGSVAAAIRAHCPAVRDLTGETDLLDLVRVARGAAVAIGNDTGPMHIAAVTGIPSLVLFSGASDPRLTAPRGPRVRILRAPSIADLGVARVEAAVRDLLDG